MPALSQKEFAQHRGVSPPYINRLVKRGTITLDGNGKIDSDAADAILGAVADPGKAGVTAYHAARRGAQPDAPVAPPATDGGAPVGAFNRAKTVDATFIARLREIDYKERVGQLIERAAYAKGNEDAAAALRKELEAIQHRLAPLVAGETSLVRCRELIAAEIDRACTAIADTLEALAAPPRSGTRQ